MTAAKDSQLTCPVRSYSWAGDFPPLTGFRQWDAEDLEPVFFTSDAQGYHVFTEHAAIQEALQNTDSFSSASIQVIDPDPQYKWIPEMLDPPEHTQWRRLLGAAFTPARAKAMEDKIRSLAVSLIDGLKDKGQCDFVSEFARQFPTAIFLDVMGAPTSDLDTFLGWEYAILHGNEETDPAGEVAMAAMAEVAQYFSVKIDEARREEHATRTDLISLAVRWEIDGSPISDADLLSMCMLMLIAGLDTVAAQLTYMFHALATTPSLRQRIIDDPAIIPKAVEEFLRVHPIVQPGRRVSVDTELRGCPLKKGEMILLPLAAAGHDDAEYDNASEIDFDRDGFRHISFGTGPHRCLGSHLARVELAVALTEWHRRIPEYHLAEGEPITEHHGGVYGLDRLPLILNP